MDGGNLIDTIKAFDEDIVILAFLRGMLTETNPSIEVNSFNKFNTLLQLGCNPKTTDEEGKTVLHLLARKTFHFDFDRFIDTLLSYIIESERTAYVNTTDADGKSAIFYAVDSFSSLPSRVDKLLDLKADPLIGFPTGSTILHQLAGTGLDVNHVGTFTRLLELGCDPTSKDEKGYTPLHIVIKNGSPLSASPFIDTLISFVDESERTTYVNATDSNGVSAIFHALDSFRWSPSQVNKLLHLDANPSVYCIACSMFLREWQSRVGTDTEEDLLHALTRLFEHGCDPRIRNERGQTILHVLAKKELVSDFHGVVDIVLSFMDESERTSYVNAKDEEGKTALIHAMDWERTFGMTDSIGDRLRMVTKLLELGCDPMAQDKRGQTALYGLALRPEYVDQFLDALLSFVDEADRSSYVNMMDAKGNSVLCCLMQTTSFREINTLLDLDANPFVGNPSGSRILHTLLTNAAQQYSNPHSDAFQVITRLLRLGFDPNSQDEKGQTALHLLTKASNEESKSEIVSLVLQYGADPLIPDNEGNLPLTYLGDPDCFDATATLFLLRLMVGTGFGPSD